MTPVKHSFSRVLCLTSQGLRAKMFLNLRNYRQCRYELEDWDLESLRPRHLEAVIAAQTMIPVASVCSQNSFATALLVWNLDVLGSQPRMFGDPSKHFRPISIFVVEGECVGTELRMVQLCVRASLRNNCPANSLQSAKYLPCFGARPMAQADFSRTLMDVGISLDASTSSATA